MFDIGFWELIVIAIIGIIVVGPEKLPSLVKTVIIQVRKIKRMFNDVREDFERELDLNDLKRLKDHSEIAKSMEEFNRSIQDVKHKADELSNDITTQIDAEIKDADFDQYPSEYNMLPVSQMSVQKKAKLSGIANDLAKEKSMHNNADWENDAATFRDTGIEKDNDNNQELKRK